MSALEIVQLPVLSDNYVYLAREPVSGAVAVVDPAVVEEPMAEAARRTIVVCDSSKFGRRSLSLIMPTSSVHETITDRKVSKQDLKALRDAEVEVTLV